MHKELIELENLKQQLKKLVLGEEDAQIIELGSKCLNLLLKLYSELKGRPEEQAKVEENFLHLYYYVFQVTEIPYLNQLSFPKAPFASSLKGIHRQLAQAAAKKNLSALEEYHLKKAVQFEPSEEAYGLLAHYYAKNNEFRSALACLESYPGPITASLLAKKIFYLGKMDDFAAITPLLPQLKRMIAAGEFCPLLILKFVGMDNQTVFNASKNFQKKLEGRQNFHFRGSKETLRLGYIGSNFIPHAQSYQFGTDFFKEHGNSFELFIYSLRGDGSSSTEKSIKEQVDTYVNAERLSNEALLQRIRDDQIDILVNCNGHADDSRPYEILCYRAAPVQIDYLGYPGTSGAAYIDYYVGDRISTPPDKLGPYFTEKLILMPHTYQVTEHRTSYSDLGLEKLTPKEIKKTLLQRIEENKEQCLISIGNFLVKEMEDGVRAVYHQVDKSQAPLISLHDQLQFLQKHIRSITRESLDQSIRLSRELPLFLKGELFQEKAEFYVSKMFPKEEWVDGRFIFASLNHHVKLSAKDIACWNELLKRVENSVLLLLTPAYEAKKHLLSYFDQEVQDRIFFAGFLPKPLHMQRLRGIDLVLDSFYYGAHTTAGDALWAGVPIATCTGDTMESRVCSSMLAAAGLGDLAAKDRQGYIDFSFRCATDRVYYQEIKERVQQARNSPLFDKPLYVHHLTTGFLKGWERFCEGKQPELIII